MEIGQRMPDLSDLELERLHANAVRLAQSGTPGQRQRAEHLLPLLGAALEQRRRERVEAQTLVRRTNARRKAVAAAGMTPEVV
jgi:hypothetical protein